MVEDSARTTGDYYLIQEAIKNVLNQPIIWRLHCFFIREASHEKSFNPMKNI